MNTKECSIIKLVNSPHKTSRYAYKTTPIFTAITHNAPVYSLNQHMFCDLKGIPRYPQTQKWGVSPSSATLPEFLIVL